MNGCEEVIFFMIKNIIVDGNTRRNQFRHPAFHQFLGQLRIFQLVADGNTFTGSHQFRQIRIEGMMRETGHFDKLSRPVGFLRLNDPENFSTNHSILTIHFVKVSYTEQKDSIRVFRFNIEILLH